MSSWLKGLLWFVGVFGAFGGLLYAFVVDVWTVHDDDPTLAAAMAPTIEGGDVLVLMKKPGVDHNHLTRCADPEAPGRYVVGRAKGTRGARVEIARDAVRIDGHPDNTIHTCAEPRRLVVDPRTGEEVPLGCFLEGSSGLEFETLRDPAHADAPRTYTVGPGETILVSDNRAMHLDARDFGPLPDGSCQHIVLRLWGKGGPTDGRRRLNVLW